MPNQTINNPYAGPQTLLPGLSGPQSIPTPQQVTQSAQTQTPIEGINQTLAPTDFLAQFQQPIGQVNVPDTFDISQLSFGGGQDFNFVQQESTDPFEQYRDFFNVLGISGDNFSDVVSSLNEPVEARTEEVSTTQKTLMDAIKKFGGITTRRQELFNQLGIAGQEQQLQDLSQEIAQKTAAFQNLIESLPGQGRGITSDIISGQQARVRRQAAVELGGLAAVAQAVQGNIASAQDLIDRTITQEFEPILNQINQLQTQLDINYDNLTAAEKRRADQLSLILGERQRFINEQAKEKGDIANLMLVAAENGAPINSLRNIYSSGNFIDALSQASNYLSTSEKLTIKDQFDLEKTTRSDFEKYAADARTAKNQIETIQTAGASAELRKTLSADDPNASINAASQGVLVAFQKLLDPTSVVRESEYARSGSGQSLVNRIEGKWEQLTRGGAGVAAEDLNEFVTLAQQFYENYNDDLIDLMIRTKNIADDYGLDIERVLRPSDIELLSDFYEEQIANFINSNPTEQENIETLIAENPNLSNEEIWQIINPSDFNQVGSDTNNSFTQVSVNNVDNVAEAIGQYESGGNYGALGPVVQGGQYAGQRALGKYQIMPGNLPSWSREALGREVTPQEFLNSPQIQDVIAKDRFRRLIAQYGNIQDVASVWFSGRPVSQAGQASDVLGTTVPQYVTGITSIYNRLA